MITEGALKNTVPVIYVALRDSFQWSATETASVFSLAGLVGGLGAPLIGRLLDRWGPRYLFFAGGVLIALGWWSSSLVTALWPLLLLYGVIATLGENSIASFTTTAALSPWFPRTRGRILGLVDAGNPLGAVLFLPLAQWLISTIGWRSTFRILGLLFFLLVGPANFLWQRRSPQQHVGTDQAKAACATPETGASEHARRRPQVAGALTVELPLWRQLFVWFLVLARLSASVGIHLTSVHMMAFFIAAGYDPLLAASAIAGVGLLSIVGRPLSGTLSDVLGREVIYTAGLGMHIGAILVVLMLGDGQHLWPLLLFVGLSGLSDGIAGLVVGAKAADLFPARRLGTVMGMVQMGRGLGIMVGPLLGGFLFDLHGDYRLAFLLAMALVGTSISCMWAVRYTAALPGWRRGVESPAANRRLP